MTSVKEFFHTDFSAMTASDYVGLAMTIVIFLLMVVAYVHAFRPKNKERFDSYRNIPLQDEQFEERRIK